MQARMIFFYMYVQFVPLVDRLEFIRPQGRLVPHFCAAIMASAPRAGPAEHRGGFQQKQFVHIADSVLSNGSNNSPKADNTWLGVTADVRRGRSIARHTWRAPQARRRSSLSCRSQATTSKP